MESVHSVVFTSLLTELFVQRPDPPEKEQVASRPRLGVEGWSWMNTLMRRLEAKSDLKRAGRAAAEVQTGGVQTTTPLV